VVACTVAGGPQRGGGLVLGPCGCPLTFSRVCPPLRAQVSFGLLRLGFGTGRFRLGAGWATAWGAAPRPRVVAPAKLCDVVGSGPATLLFVCACVCEHVRVRDALQALEVRLRPLEWVRWCLCARAKAHGAPLRFVFLSRANAGFPCP
jgi:hypothetical protein